MYVCRLLFHMNVNMQSWHMLHINFNDIVTLYRSVTLSKCLIWWTMWPKRGWLFKNFDPNFNQYFLMNNHVCLFFKMFVFCFCFFWTRNHYHTYYESTVTHSLMIFFFRFVLKSAVHRQLTYKHSHFYYLLKYVFFFLWHWFKYRSWHGC